MCEETTADEAAVPGGLLGGRETASAANGCARRADAGRPRGAMADGYRLWAPSPLDESLGWLRGTRPQPPPAASAHPFRWAGLQAAAGGQRGGGAALPRPQAVRLQSLDAVFERLVTAQPPRRIGVLRVSERSARQGGRPAAVAGPRAAGGGSEGGRRHVPADDARHPAAVRRLQEVRLRPAARPLHAGGTQLGGAAFEPRPELSHLEAPLRLGMLSAQPYLCGPTPEQYRKAAGGGRRLWRWPPAPSGG